MDEIKILKFIGIAILFVYIYFSYKIIQEDLQHYKISNKLQMQMLKAFLIFFILICSWLISHSTNSFIGFIKIYFIHLVLSVIGGYVLWYSDYWPAGDAKFYILSMFFLPLILLPSSSKYYPFHLWLSSMSNSFILAVVYVLIKFFMDIFHFDKSKINLTENFNKNESDNWVYYFKAITINTLKILIFFIFGKFINIFFKNIFASLFERPEFIYFFIFFFWDELEKNVFNKKIYLIVSVSFYILYFGIMFYLNPKLLIEQLGTCLKYAGFITIIITLLRKIFDKIMLFSSVEYLKISEIKEGMLLSEKELEKIKHTAPDIYQKFKDYSYFKGLTEIELNALNQFVFKLNLNKMDFEVYKIKSFSVWIFIGCIIQLVFDFNIINVLIWK